MKSLAPIVSLLFMLLPALAHTQSAGIDEALSKGNAADLGVFFAPKVDVSILDVDASLSSNDAVSTFRDFFEKNTVKLYKRAHVSGPDNGRSGYSLGDLLTSTGTYRIYLYFNSAKQISEIRIEK